MFGAPAGFVSGPEDVEHGPDAQFLAYRCHVLHRRMMVGREHEADAGPFEALPQPAPD
jgi:hypothetical protein